MHNHTGFFVLLMLVLIKVNSLPLLQKQFDHSTASSDADQKEEKEIGSVEQKHARIRRSAVRSKDKLWPRGVLKYAWAVDIDKTSKKTITKAMNHISAQSCVRFRKTKNLKEDHVNFISGFGCYSDIGRTGHGAQNLSIGRGCNRYMGVAVHELMHALGFYHEQQRSDRDKYVDVHEEFIGDKYLKDFKKQNRSKVNSRGYPYDFQSIMHYKEYTFTNTGDKTIEIKNADANFDQSKLGQRVGLSDIDIAQLRDLYHCNRKQDKMEKECPAGWIKHKTSCYKFVKRPKLQFDLAVNHCKSMDSHLVNINNQPEDRFLKNHLSTYHTNVLRWIIGGRKINGTFYWIGKMNEPPMKMKYTNWGKTDLTKYTSLILKKINRSSKIIEWKGSYAASPKLYPKYAYAFICEKEAKRPCVRGKTKDGADYRGKLAHTTRGVTCQRWSSQYPHKHDVQNEKLDGFGNHNFCRNPLSLKRERPWCYTTKSKIEWDYCDITICPD